MVTSKSESIRSVCGPRVAGGTIERWSYVLFCPLFFKKSHQQKQLKWCAKIQTLGATSANEKHFKVRFVDVTQIGRVLHAISTGPPAIEDEDENLASERWPPAFSASSVSAVVTFDSSLRRPNRWSQGARYNESAVPYVCEFHVGSSSALQWWAPIQNGEIGCELVDDVLR
ncbi:radical SAM protein, TIGR01212 family [Anopheles sinensis]|uniref:Radical SAM protein, TIGR01212 family n=1 Tax=Anopheles sinensis TaxID=74873 RepID=A0A084W5S6_ANOSI|nr:radical SAM protein, TIGR01212 family [Anopheles sinensis]